MKKKSLKAEIEVEFGSNFQIDVFVPMVNHTLGALMDYINTRHKGNTAQVKLTGSAVKEYYKALDY